MKISSSEEQKEKEYLNKVLDTIRNNIKEKTHKINELKKDIIKAKKHLWQNNNEYNGVEMHATMDENDLKVSIINAEIIKTARLERSLNEPYFGKVVFNGENIYVGITTIEDNKQEYVYDWRAPISNLYYNFGLGHAFYNAPTGNVEGNITSKRQFKIEMGNLINAFDSDVTVEDEILQEVLLNDSSNVMKNIVSTIQKEQNEIIRRRIGRDLIIEGIAGSGKTSVALHRIAYLLYNAPNLTNKNVIIFSPNDVFTSYISNVLPELGEENVPSITKTKLFEKYVNGLLETPMEFIERCYKNNYSEDIKNKFTYSYKDKLDEYIKNYTNNVTFTKKIGLKDKFITSSELNDMYKSLTKLSLPNRLEYMAEKICDLYDISIDNASRLYVHLKKMINLSSNPIEIYKDFLNSEELFDDYIPYEDITPMMYLYFELNGYPNYSHIKHIVIDEAQDYSLLDFYLLKRIFNSATFTILGDKNQSINPYLKYGSLKDIRGIFKDSLYETMNKAYRSSREIVEYTNKLLNIDNIDAVRRSTNTNVVENGDLANLESDINFLMNKYKRIALITKTQDECDSLYKKYASKNIGLISDSILKRVVIVPSYLAKGLEFDAVIVLNKSSYKKEEESLLYVACTRAQHELIVYK